MCHQETLTWRQMPRVRWRRLCLACPHQGANFHDKSNVGLDGGGAGVDFVGKCELVLFIELLSDVFEFLVTIVGSQEASMDGQRGAIVSWRLQLQVCVMSDCHELGKRCTP